MFSVAKQAVLIPALPGDHDGATDRQGGVRDLGAIIPAKARLVGWPVVCCLITGNDATKWTGVPVVDGVHRCRRGGCGHRRQKLPCRHHGETEDGDHECAGHGVHRAGVGRALRNLQQPIRGHTNAFRDSRRPREVLGRDSVSCRAASGPGVESRFRRNSRFKA